MRKHRWLFGVALASAVLGSAAVDAAQVRGRVTAQNKPVAGVTVSAIPYETPFEEARREARHEAEPAPLASATSAADGAFVLTLPPSTSRAMFRIAIAGSGVTLARLDRVLDSSRDEDVGDLAASRAQPLAGRVVDPKGGPVVGATVLLFGGTFLSPRPVTAVTGADGTFRFAQASEAGNRLRVEAPGFAAFERSGIRSGPMAKPLSLAFGSTVEGAVVMPDRRTSAAGSLVRFEGVAPSRWTETRRDGGFTVEGVAGSGSIVAEGGAQGRGSALLQVGEKLTIVLAPPATLRGRVVDAATGAPIDGVVVAATNTAGATFTARTDPRGTYALVSLAIGSYALSADEPRYVPWSREHVTVAAGALAVDAALVRAGALTGRVLDSEGRPIDGASVRVTPNARGAFDAFLQAAQGRGLVRTGPDGGFKAARLQPGTRQSLTVSHDAFESRTLGGIDVAPGATRSVTVTLPRGRTVRGTVKDEEGQPVAGAEVRLMRALGFRSRGGGMSMMMAGGPGARAAVETGADGGFEVKGLATGDYQLSVSKRGYASESVDPVKVSETASAQPMEIVLHAGVTATGFIHTRAGAGVAGYRVMARPTEKGGGRGFGGPITESPTGPDGVFLIEGLRANESYDLQAVREGGGSGLRSTRITPPVDGVELVTDGNGRIRGTVTDSDGRPVPDFQVSYAMPPGGGPRMFFSFGGTAPAGSENSPLAVHADDGSFVLDDVPAGRWNVEALAKGFQPGTAANVDVAEGDPGEAVEIRLARGTTIRGQVVESRSGRAVAGASVEAQLAHERSFFFGMNPRPNPNATTTDADGRFEIAGLPPGTYSVTATHPEWTEASASVDLKDQPTSVDLRLGKGGGITGVVLSGGRGVGSASVALAPSGEGMQFGMGGRSAVSDDAGRFAFDRLTAGRYSATAELRGQSSPPVEAVIASPDASQDVTLTLAAGALIRGVVSGLAEGERGGVYVHASGPEDFFASSRTAADGSFEIPGAPAGLISLNATVGGFTQSSRSARTSVTVAEGQTEVSTEVSFEGGFRVEGHVTRGGRPVTDAMIFARAEGTAGMGSSGRTDDGGGFNLEGLKEGLYDLTAASTSGGEAETKVQVKGDTTADLEIPSARIAGLVVESGSGRPLADATISGEGRQHGFGFLSVKSDSAGRFALEGLDPSPYRVMIRKPAYQTEVRELTPSQNDDVTIELRRGEGMGIEARDGIYGMALHGISVRILDATGSIFAGPVALDSDGRGEIPAVAPGTYQLRAASEGYAPISLPPVTVPSAPISLTLTPGGALEIQIGPQTLTKPNASGRILNADGTVYLPWIYSDDGVIKLMGPSRRIENVVPGRYAFVADDGTRREFQVQEGASATVSLP